MTAPVDPRTPPGAAPRSLLAPGEGQGEGIPTRLLLLILLAPLLLGRPSGAQPTPEPTAAVAATPTAAAIPLADVAGRSDEVGVYLTQVEERARQEGEATAIAAGLPQTAVQVREKAAATTALLGGDSPALRDIDNLAEAWRMLRSQLDDWSATLTTQVTQLDQEVAGLDRLRRVWRATREQARVESAPPAVLERIGTTLEAIGTLRKGLDERRKQLLVLQGTVVEQSAATREPLRALGSVRRQGFGRLLVADSKPVWALYPAAGVGSALRAALAATAEELSVTRRYLDAHRSRLLLQFACFALLAWVLYRARPRLAALAADDPSMARGARIFDAPMSAAALVLLVASGWFLPDAPLLLIDLIGLVALLPTLLVLRRVIDPPAVPALWALGIFYVVDQATRFLSSQPFLEQALFSLERLGIVAFLVWFLRSGRFRAMWEADSRWAASAERGAGTLIVLVGFSAVAGALGYMQLSRYLQEALVDSVYAALVLYGSLQVLEALWASLLRTRLARRLHMVDAHRALLQRRGERLLGWLAFAAWVLVSLRNARVLDILLPALRGLLGGQLTVGSLTLSLGAVLAFVVTVWLSFVVSRFVRFVLAEDVYPRVALAPGMPYALSSLLHYAILLVGFFMAMAATGIDMNRFTILAGAFGVGIGFGMQNIVNNFVSGLILLFERPMKVGDTIQLAQLSGEVKHIGIRSSIVRTFDGADVIVPNGDFISGAVTNWTFSDRRRRIELPLGVAYGSDPEQVLALLRRVAGGHPLVIEQPAPTALFLGFGAAALNFELRCWTDTFDKAVTTRSELAVAVNAALAEAGIDIASPQRDTRLSSGDEPLTIRVVGDKA